MLEKHSSIKKLEEKINSLKKLTARNSIELREEIEALETKVLEIKKNMWDNLEPWDRVTVARSAGRWTALNFINMLFDNFTELQGDRIYGNDSAIIGGIGYCNGVPVTVIGEQKGRTTDENIKRNFGMPNPEGYRKSLRLMKQAEKFGRPIITFIDTPGAYCGIGAEERGQGEAIARNIMEMSALMVPVLSIIIGEGGSGGALALAVGNEVWMFENAIYSILSPEGFASILWKDSSKAMEASKVMKITAKDLYEFGVVDKVIKEPLGGKSLSENLICELKRDIYDFITRLSFMSTDEIYEQRYKKFRKCYIV